MCDLILIEYIIFSIHFKAARKLYSNKVQRIRKTHIIPQNIIEGCLYCLENRSFIVGFVLSCLCKSTDATVGLVDRKIRGGHISVPIHSNMWTGISEPEKKFSDPIYELYKFKSLSPECFGVDTHQVTSCEPHKLSKHYRYTMRVPKGGHTAIDIL